MSRPLICFLDVDGVLADFVGGCCEVFGISREYLYERWPPGIWNFHPSLQITEDQFWADIDAQGIKFWRNLEPMPDMADILQVVEERFGDNVALLTSPPRNPLAVAGKVEWIQKYLPKYRRKFFVGPAKHLLAHPRAILIDDYDANVQKFQKAGGLGIVVPRRWNHLHDHPISAAEFVSTCLCFVGSRG